MGLGLKRDQTPAIFPPVVTPKVIVTSVSTAGLTKRQCACKMALKASGLSSAYACDPYLQQNYLVCQDDGTFNRRLVRLAKPGVMWRRLALRKSVDAALFRQLVLPCDLPILSTFLPVLPGIF